MAPTLLQSPPTAHPREALAAGLLATGAAVAEPMNADAARKFVADQPSNVRLAVVAFSDSANVVQPPTRSKRDVLDAINRLKPRGGTALGRGILAS